METNTYKIEKIKSKRYTLIQGDCMNYLSQIPDKSIDLILTDPPYNIAKYSTGNIPLPGRSALNNDLGEWDLAPIEPIKLIDDFKRILKPDGNIFIFTSYNLIGKYKFLTENFNYLRRRKNVFKTKACVRYFVILTFAIKFNFLL